MLGPSGFFLPSEPVNAELDSNVLELIHTSKYGFNELYRVCRNGRFFVYKALKKEYRGNQMYEDLLVKDFNIGFSLNHPGICQYYAKISHPEIGSCIVMEWIDGITLEEYIAGGMDRSLARKIICELCDAIGYMHRKQVIHRDLKPENILVTHNGQNVRIIDFGLSDADSYNSFKSPAGTRVYASPELVAGESIDNRSDIWSLGVIIGEMHPYYRRVSGKCLARDRGRRYGSAEDVKKAVLKEGVRKLRTAVVPLVVLACMAAAAVMAVRRMTQHEEPVMAPSVVLQPAVETPPADVAPAALPDPDSAPVSETDPKPSEENIDAEALEDLFKEAAGQIL